MKIIELILDAFTKISWPLVTIVIGIYLIKKIPEYLGVFQYKHLSLMVLFKEQIYHLQDVFRKYLKDGILDNDGIEKVYETIDSNYIRYDIERFYTQYLSIYPQLKNIKLEPFKRKLKDLKDKKSALQNYINNINAVSMQILSVEEFRDREQLEKFLQIIPTWLTALK